jgi:hypothetical protein
MTSVRDFVRYCQGEYDIPVIFRRWKCNPHTVVALFPEIAAGDGLCLSFEHIGQHGAADYSHVIRHTQPVTPEKYADLKTELEQRGYATLVIRKHRKKGCQQFNLHANQLTRLADFAGVSSSVLIHAAIHIITVASNVCDWPSTK